MTFSQLLVKARRNEEEEITSRVVNKNVTVENKPTLEQRVDNLIAKSDRNRASPNSLNRDNNQNYGRPPFQSNQRFRGDYRPPLGHPQGDIRQNLKGPETSAAGPFRDADGLKPIQCFRCRGWGPPKRLCPLWLNYTWGRSGMGTSLPTNGRETGRSPSQAPISSEIYMKISQVADKYHNPDPLLRLIGLANEAKIIVEGQEFPALIDSGAQLSTMSESLVQALKLPFHKLNTLIEADVSGGGTIPYVGYVEAKLKIPDIQAMDKDSLFMVSNNSPYADRVPIQLGTLHIREAIQLATRDEMNTLPSAWKTANFWPYTDKRLAMKEPEFNLDKIKGHVKLTKSVTIPPFQTIHASGLTECDQHFKRVNVIVEPDPDKDYESVVAIHGYTVLKPGSSHVSIGLRNHSCHRVTVQAKSIVAKVSAANVVPHSLAPNLDYEDMFKQFKQY